jgi:hypothetical protein
MKPRFRAAILFLAGVPAVSAAAERPVSGPVAKVLALFEGRDASGEGLLQKQRPSPLAPALRAAVVAALPLEGALTPSASEAVKIVSLDPIFESHERKDLVVVKVIDVGYAFVGLHARMVLLLSRDALAVVTASELQALAIHELAHEVFWDEYQAAIAARDEPRMQELELLCDGITVLTLKRLQRAPDDLLRAVTKIVRHNEGLGTRDAVRSHVSLEDRRYFIRKVSALMDDPSSH